MPNLELTSLIPPKPEDVLYLNGYVVTRIVYELIKNYLISNRAADCGIELAQVYNVDQTRSDIKLDIAYNWKTNSAGKVPAIYVQRGEIDLKNMTLGTTTRINQVTGSEHRMVMTTMPVIVSCVAAEPLAVVENLAQFVKQPLLYFRKEVEEEFGIRRLMVDSISPPKVTPEGKNNFFVDLNVTTVFDERWCIKRESLKINRIAIRIFDAIKNAAPVELETFYI